MKITSFALLLLVANSSLADSTNNEFYKHPEWWVVIVTAIAMLCSNILTRKQIKLTESIYNNQRKDNAATNAINFLNNLASDEKYKKVLILIEKLNVNKQSFHLLYHNGDEGLYQKELELLSLFLDKLETMAIGIEQKALDDEILRLSLYDVVITIYNSSKSLIDNHKSQSISNKHIYTFLSKLVIRWKQIGVKGQLPYKPTDEN